MKRNVQRLLIVFGLSVLSLQSINAIAAGENADWMRGAWGLNWKPVYYTNHHVDKDMSIEPFMRQIEDFESLDYIQVHLNESYIFSAAHTAPHDVLESLWQGDRDQNGDPVNLIVPRASTGRDQFQDWLTAIKNRNLRTMVYVNSGHLLWDLPEAIADVQPRFKEWCDTNVAARRYLNREPYRTDSNHPDRRYMFCYARFILQEYSERYGDLIDAWIFDTASFMTRNGDVKGSLDIDDQRIFEAFSLAAKAGNPEAVVSFNQGVGERTGPGSPLAVPTIFDDYTFGHPFGGAGDMTVPQVLYDYNFRVMSWMSGFGGYAFRHDGVAWNDNIVAHFDPKMSTTAWNRGATPALTDEEFVEWNAVGLINGGAISWGAPLRVPFMNRDQSAINLTLHDYAVRQLSLMDSYLQDNQTQSSSRSVGVTGISGRNVALTGTASQSSTSFGATASRAIDGNTSGIFLDGSVSHTSAEDAAWWSVTLDSEVTLDEIVIHNRSDRCCRERLSNFVVYVWNEAGERVLRRIVSTTPNTSMSINANNVDGYQIRIKSLTPQTSLNLAEVEVIAQ